MWEDFEASDWEHSIGGTHVVAEVDGRVIAHASVVERTLEIAGRPYRTGYVEAVATAPSHRQEGHGTRVMRDVGEIIRDGYELGGLGTGIQPFYERLGWERWQGPTYVRRAGGLERTPEDDDAIMVLRTDASAAIDLTAPIACHERPGDDW